MKSTILLVEDNSQNRYLATYLLEREGHRVIHAHNGREALDAVSREKPDLVLMDIQMPEMDGYEAARAIRAVPEHSALRFVAVTSYAMAGDRERAFAEGFIGYIEKPLDTATFVPLVTAYLTGKEHTA